MTTFLAKQNFYDSILNKRVLYTTEFGKLWNWHMQIYNTTQTQTSTTSESVRNIFEIRYIHMYVDNI